MIKNLFKIKNEQLNWTNKDNISFYDSVMFDSYCVASGLDQFIDLKVFMHYLTQDEFRTLSILEIGAGEGRIIDGLLSYGYPGDIQAIELSEKKFNLLEK